MAKAKTKSKPRSRRLSRSLLDNMIRDLGKRIDKLEDEAEAFAVIIMPNGRHTVIESQTRLACGVMLDSLQRRIRDVSGLCDILVGDKVSP